MFASLSAEQLEGLAGFNPCYREHALIPSRPGELLAQSVIEVWPRKGMRADLATRRIPDSATSRTPGIGRVFLHVVVDTYSSYAFAVLRHKASAGSALTLLNDIVQPFFAERRLTVERIRTEDRRPFSRSKAQRYPLDLVRQGITQECTSRKQGPNGFVERFVQIAQEEFLEQALYAVDRYPSLSVLQDEFARWVTCYNTERANLGYPHGGQRPRELIAAYLASQPAAS